jgi:hypothetical protein
LANVRKRDDVAQVLGTHALDSHGRYGQMLGAVLCVPVYHFARLPATPFLEIIARRSRLAMPSSPRVAQVMEPKITDTNSRMRSAPSRIGDLPAPRRTPKGETVAQAFSNLLSQYLNRIFIEPHSPRHPVAGKTAPGPPANCVAT